MSRRELDNGRYVGPIAFLELAAQTLEEIAGEPSRAKTAAALQRMAARLGRKPEILVLTSEGVEAFRKSREFGAAITAREAFLRHDEANADLKN